ncbi:sulfotransferase family protein [Rubrivirga sp.]|uniref:sulfotransferase family protein n=1 Tax=Rubrivirga sp. TaxID=1885344 RepID=UPI003B528930
MTQAAPVHPALTATPPPNPTGGAWPTFLVIGAMKCGTTSLHHYLSLHPGIGMSAQKELSFFAAERTWGRGADWYRAWFSPDDPVRGDVSPAYATAPVLGGVPERIHALVPDVRLVYLVRDPIDRIVAQYAHAWWQGTETRPLPEAVRASPDAYVARSRYFFQIERYLPYFDARQLLVVDQDDLLRRRRATLGEVFAFVGADPDVWDPRFQIRHHRTGQKRRLTPLGERLVQARGFQALRHLPRDLQWHAERWVTWPVSRPVPTPVVTPALRAELEDAFTDDVARLRAFTDKPFASWSL